LPIVPTDFAWRSPSQAVPKNDGVQILALSEQGSSRARFLHYDGYDVRSWSVEILVGKPEMANVFFDKTSVHTVRDDVAF
jgi:hypothetical protein